MTKINVKYQSSKAIPLWTFDLPSLTQKTWKWWILPPSDEDRVMEFLYDGRPIIGILDDPRINSEVGYVRQPETSKAPF